MLFCRGHLLVQSFVGLNNILSPAFLAHPLLPSSIVSLGVGWSVTWAEMFFQCRNRVVYRWVRAPPCTAGKDVKSGDDICNPQWAQVPRGHEDGCLLDQFNPLTNMAGLTWEEGEGGTMIASSFAMKHAASLKYYMFMIVTPQKISQPAMQTWRIKKKKENSNHVNLT